MLNLNELFSGNYAILDVERVKVSIKKAILKALEQGTIKRSATSKKALGTGGSFVLNDKKRKSNILQKKNKVKSLSKQRKEKSGLEDDLEAT